MSSLRRTWVDVLERAHTDIGCRVRMLAEDRDVSLSAYARDVGLSPSCLCQVARGERAPSADTCVRLWEGEGRTLSLHWLLTGEGEGRVRCERRGDVSACACKRRLRRVPGIADALGMDVGAMLCDASTWPSVDTLVVLHARMPRLSLHWVLTGEGHSTCAGATPMGAREVSWDVSCASLIRMHVEDPGMSLTWCVTGEGEERVACTDVGECDAASVRMRMRECVDASGMCVRDVARRAHLREDTLRSLLHDGGGYPSTGTLRALADAGDVDVHWVLTGIPTTGVKWAKTGGYVLENVA